MKFADKLIEKVGVDKLLHFLVTSWIVAEAKCFGWIPMLIAFVILVGLGIYKEKKLDVYTDYVDLKWSIYGGLLSIFLYALKYFI